MPREYLVNGNQRLDINSGVEEDFTQPVLSGIGRTLTVDDSGALCLFSTAAGYTYTLPPAQKGLWFDFLIVVTNTTPVDRVACTTGDFILGAFMQSPDGTDPIALMVADGAADLAWESDGTTTGGYAGDRFTLTAINSTQWVIQGFGLATGSEATPIKTS